MSDHFVASFKILTLGATGAGKTALTKRYVDGAYSGRLTSTIGVDVQYKVVRARSTPVKLQIWDTAGQERYGSLTNAFFRGTHGVVVAYDCTSRASFAAAERWLKSMHEVAEADPTQPKIAVVLCACKADLEDKVEVRPQKCHALGRLYACKSFITSARSGENVIEAFDCLVDEIAKNVLPSLRHAASVPPSAARSTIRLAAATELRNQLSDRRSSSTAEPKPSPSAASKSESKCCF